MANGWLYVVYIRQGDGMRFVKSNLAPYFIDEMQWYTNREYLNSLPRFRRFIYHTSKALGFYNKIRQEVENNLLKSDEIEKAYDAFDRKLRIQKNKIAKESDIDQMNTIMQGWSIATRSIKSLKRAKRAKLKQHTANPNGKDWYGKFYIEQTQREAFSLFRFSLQWGSFVDWSLLPKGFYELFKEMEKDSQEVISTQQYQRTFEKAE